MIKDGYGGWWIDLRGVCPNELKELGELLVELGSTGYIDGIKFENKGLQAIFDSKKSEVYLTDGKNNTRSSNE